MSPAVPTTARPTITVLCRAFARYAELLGASEFPLELPAGSTVADAIALIRRSMPRGAELPERPVVAVNLEQARAGRPLQAGDELALLPPMAGG